MVSEECDIRDQVELDCTNKISFSPVQKAMKTAKNCYHNVLWEVKYYFVGAGYIIIKSSDRPMMIRIYQNGDLLRIHVKSLNSRYVDEISTVTRLQLS